MQLIWELGSWTPEVGTTLTIGVFDGVHLGHRHLIEELKREAAERGLLSGVVTFRRHPQEVLAPEAKLTFLTTLEERIDLIRSLGIELIVPLSFTTELAQLSARSFVSLLQQHLRMQGLVLGPDFALGRGREGDAVALNALGQELGFSVTSVPYLRVGGQVVSSTTIREALSRGDVEAVSRLLGRYFSLSGAVVSGVERGRSLGFPTANIALEPGRALPADGVYIARAYIDGEIYMAVTNIGVRPTFGGGEWTVEVYILDFHGDLYGRKLTMELVQRVRGEMYFATPEELKMQIERDVQRARAVLR
jgi:riboflavin kinase/FMN adenylyltransferase